MNGKDWFTLVQDTAGSFGHLYQDSMRDAGQEVGFQGRDGFIIMQALAHEPNPLIPELTRYPYTKIDLRRQNLAEVAERGYMEKVGDDQYRVNQRGRDGIYKVYGTAQHHIGKIMPLPEDELSELHCLLKRVVTTTLASNKLKTKRYIETSRTVAPPDDAPKFALIDQYLTDLIFYRDDSHENAWRTYAIEGHDWEVLSLIWEGKATSLESLIQQESLGFDRRGFTPEEYQQSLDRLVERGWLSQANDSYALTTEGKRIRDEAEANTDENYYIGWANLDEAENKTLEQLMLKLQNAVKQIALSEA